MSDDPNDLEALTANHFLLGPRIKIQPLLPDASRHVDCRRTYKMAQGYNEMIWQRWNKEYLPKCHARAKWDQKAKQSLEVGDLV